MIEEENSHSFIGHIFRNKNFLSAIRSILSEI